MERLIKSFASSLVLGTSLYFICNSCIDRQLSYTPTSPSGKKEVGNVTNGSSTGVIFSTDVGAPIDRSTAVRWMNNFTGTNKGTASEYFVPVSLLKSILASTSCVGVVLYYAVDSSGELHIIPIGVDGTGKVISWKTLALGNASVDWLTAWQWINNYSGTLKSHFFGSKILVSTYFKAKSVRISRAINDDGVPQLLLSDGSDVAPQGYGDASGGCPPFCPNI